MNVDIHIQNTNSKKHSKQTLLYLWKILCLKEREGEIKDEYMLIVYQFILCTVQHN